jgi:ABC-type Na+ efflux pump permease subunit
MLKEMLKDKKNIIIAAVLVLILLAALVLTIVNKRQKGTANPSGNQGTGTLAEPDFLTAQEKTALRLDNSVKAQVLTRDASGSPAVYKIINSDADIIADPSKIGSLSPRQTGAAQ